MIEATLEKIVLDIEAAKILMWNADSDGDNGLRITIWQDICKLLDKKHELEEGMRISAKGYEL